MVPRLTKQRLNVGERTLTVLIIMWLYRDSFYHNVTVFPVQFEGQAVAVFQWPWLSKMLKWGNFQLLAIWRVASAFVQLHFEASFWSKRDAAICTYSTSFHLIQMLWLFSSDSESDFAIIQELEVVPGFIVTHVSEVDSIDGYDLILHLQLTAFLSWTTCSHTQKALVKIILSKFQQF